MFVRDVMRRHGWDRAFMLVYKKEEKGTIEELISPDPPPFFERNRGLLPPDHDANEL
jgi:hypothetical protein